MEQTMTTLLQGWDEAREHEFSYYRAAGLIPGRIIREDRGSYLAWCPTGTLRVELSGKLQFCSATREDLPVTGDFVAVNAIGMDTGIIHAVLHRRTVLERKGSGNTTDRQLLASNMDVVCITIPMTAAFNVRKTERFLLLVSTSGAKPVIVLTKKDIATDPEAVTSEARECAGDVPVIVVSAVDGFGIDALRKCLPDGSSAVFIGSSGAGKSTLINVLAGKELLATGEIRECDGRGRHTTTRREIILSDTGALLMDSPGLRELALLLDEEQVLDGFDEIAVLARSCRFGDCRHESEPGCAVLAAVTDGSLDVSRLESFRKIRKEAEYFQSKTDPRAGAAEKRKWKQISKLQKAMYRHNDSDE